MNVIQVVFKPLKGIIPFVWINEQDFDPELHEYYVEPVVVPAPVPAPVVETGRKPKSDS